MSWPPVDRLASTPPSEEPDCGAQERNQAFKLKRDNQLDYEPSEIIASAGAKQAEANVINALFDEGDEVIIPTPAWVSFAAMVSLAGAVPKFVPCPEATGFLLEPDTLRRAITPRNFAESCSTRRRIRPASCVYGTGCVTSIRRDSPKCSSTRTSG